MKGGDLSTIIYDEPRDYSEEFCQYTLYATAVGLSEMHDK